MREITNVHVSLSNCSLEHEIHTVWILNEAQHLVRPHLDANSLQGLCQTWENML